jgi:hypothetical protein
MNLYSILEEISTNDKITIQQCKELAKKGLEIMLEVAAEQEKRKSEYDIETKKFNKKISDSNEKYKVAVTDNMKKHAYNLIEFSKEDRIPLRNFIERYCMSDFEEFPDLPILTDDQCRELSEEFKLPYQEIRSEFSKEDIQLIL